MDGPDHCAVSVGGAAAHWRLVFRDRLVGSARKVFDAKLKFAVGESASFQELSNSTISKGRRWGGTLGLPRTSKTTWGRVTRLVPCRPPKKPTQNLCRTLIKPLA